MVLAWFKVSRKNRDSYQSFIFRPHINFKISSFINLIYNLYEELLISET